MSCYHIQIKDGKKMMIPVHNREEYLALRNSEQNRRADKKHMVQMNYSCLPNDDGTLKGSTRMSTTVGMDIDVPIDKDLVLSKKGELGLLMFENSATKPNCGHVVFRRRPERSQEENLRWASSLLGVAYDPGAKDITRVFYTPADKLIFLDDEIFKIEEATVVQQKPAADATPVSNASQSISADSYGDIPYDAIVTALEDQLGGVPAHGSRNQFIFSMACHLRYVCNDDPEWIARILPDYGESADKWMATIKSACARSQNKSIPKIMKRALEQARASMDMYDETFDAASCPPPMPKRLPPLIKLLVSRTPKIYQPAVAHAVFPALAAHLWKTRFKYIDNVEHEATLMNVLMAGTGAGKNCIAAPIDCIMKDIRERDAISLEKERLWKEEMNTKGANKDKKKRPEGIVIQEVDADMTNAAFVLRMSEAEEHFLYVRMNEIDQFDALKTSARSKSQFQIMCLAFDPGNSYGQTRVGTQSVSERVCIRFNWNASTTIQKGKQYFRSVLTDGPLSRINFCTIPEQPIGADIPVFGKYDAEFDSQLRPYIDRLNAARGLIECPQATRLAKKLKDENADFSRLSQSRTFENFSFRGNVIAFLKSMVLYVAQGEQWDRITEDFIRWSERYDLWCKMKFWAEMIDKANGTTPSQSGKRGPRNMLDELQDTFSLDDAIAVRRQHTLSADGTQHMLSTWKSRGYITDAEGQENHWQKTPQYLNNVKSQITVSQLF